MIYECFNCETEWMSSPIPNENEYLCGNCGCDCRKKWDRISCPKCEVKFMMGRPKAHDLNMSCGKCKYMYTDKEAEVVLGVKKVDTVDNEGNPITAFINTGNGHEFYHSPYCLKRFKEWIQMNTHDKLYHNIGDPMACCIPSGFILDMEFTCGDEDTIP